MPQFARPSSDVTTTNWTRSSGSSAYYTYIDEVTPDDNDYVQIVGTTGSGLEVGLGTVDDPNSSSDHIIRIRDWALGTGGPEARTVLLLQGATTIATVASGNPTRTVGNATTYTLTTAQADSITDYSDLRLRFTATTLGATETYRVGWAEMEVPDPPPPVTTRYILIT